MVTFQDGGGTEWAIGSLRASPLFPFLAEISLHGSQSKYQRNSITQVDKYTQFRIQFKHSTKTLYSSSANHEKSRIATKMLLSCQFIGWSRKMGLMVYTCIVSAIAIVFVHHARASPAKGPNLEFGLRETPLILGIL